MPEFNLSYTSKWQNRVAWGLASEAATEVGLADMHHQMLRLQQTVIELGATVHAMALLLVDRGQLDPKLLEQKVAAALAAHRDTTGAPMITCARCGTVVPANLTVLAADGTVCDKCAAGVTA